MARKPKVAKAKSGVLGVVLIVLGILFTVGGAVGLAEMMALSSAFGSLGMGTDSFEVIPALGLVAGPIMLGVGIREL